MKTTNNTKTLMKNLRNAEMSYPTWTLFEKLIEEASDPDYPAKHFGTKPLINGKHLVRVNATPDLKCIIGSGNYIGIDVPVLLKPKGNVNKGTIIIVGESTKRKINVFNKPNDILLGIPYAVVLGMGSPSQCDVYKKIFEGLLAEGYSIYLTDVIKIWWKGRKMTVSKDEEDLLKDEIKVINNSAKIVSWGKTASDLLRKIGYKGFLPQLHPGKNNRSNWKRKIFEKAVYGNNVNYAKKLYPNPGDKTTDDIVANEAINEILDFIS